MKRVNVVDWSDCVTITRMMGTLAEAMMKYQMYTWPPEKKGEGCFGGDQAVIIHAIELRNRLNKIIEKSSEKNAK